MTKNKKKNLTKGLSCILAFSLFIPMVSLGFRVNALAGFGSSASPYQIGSEEELKAFAEMVTENHQAYGVLTEDITLTEIWTPIGGSEGFTAYSGLFDGKSHKITLSEDGIADGEFVGLFAVNEGTIQNLTIDGGDISSQTDLAFTGGFAGLNRGTITNCTNNVNITALGKNSCAGGIAGAMQFGTIIGCVNKGSVSAKSDILSENITEKEASAGGITAFNYNGFIKKSTNNGTVTNSEEQGYTGGIAGSNNGSIDNCLNTGEVSNSDPAASGLAGGIAGLLYHNTDVGTEASIKNSLNLSLSGEVLGTNAPGENSGVLNNCYFKSENSGETDNGAVSVTTEELKDGSVTYRLNGSTAANPVWGQDLSQSDSLPVIGAADAGTVYPDGENQGGYTNTKPSHGNHDYINGTCPVCGEVIAKVAGYSITLNGAIGLNYYFDIKDTVDMDSIKITFNNKDYPLTDVTDTGLSSGLSEGYRRYLSTYTVKASQMNLSITPGLSLTYEGQSIKAEYAPYSINKYLNTLYTNPGTSNTAEVKNLARAMSTYGYYANEYFKQTPHYEAFITLSPLTVKSTDIDAKYDTYFSQPIQPDKYGLVHYASSLKHVDEIQSVFYVTGNVTENTVIRYKSKDINTGEYMDEDWIIKPVTASGSYHIAVTDKIPIAKLKDIQFEFTFGTVSEEGVYTVDSTTKYATPYSYLKNILKKYENTDTENSSYKLIQSIYNYSEAARIYFDSKNQ